MTLKPAPLIVLVIALVLVGAACSSDTESDVTTAESPSPTDAAATIVSAEEAEKLIRDDQNLVVLDVRTQEEFAEGHIEDALNVNVESATFETEIDRLVKDKPHLVYCRTGRRSALAVEQMQAQGFKTLYDMEGGIQAWEAADYPVVTGA